MHEDKNGRKLKVGDKIKRICGGKHGSIVPEGTYLIVGLGTSDRGLQLAGGGDYTYDSKYFEYVPVKKNHLPEWL